MTFSTNQDQKNTYPWARAHKKIERLEKTIDSNIKENPNPLQLALESNMREIDRNKSLEKRIKNISKDLRLIWRSQNGNTTNTTKSNYEEIISKNIPYHLCACIEILKIIELKNENSIKKHDLSSTKNILADYFKYHYNQLKAINQIYSIQSKKTQEFKNNLNPHPLNKIIVQSENHHELIIKTLKGIHENNENETKLKKDEAIFIRASNAAEKSIRDQLLSQLANQKFLNLIHIHIISRVKTINWNEHLMSEIRYIEKSSEELLKTPHSLIYTINPAYLIFNAEKMISAHVLISTKSTNSIEELQFNIDERILFNNKIEDSSKIFQREIASSSKLEWKNTNHSSQIDSIARELTITHRFIKPKFEIGRRKKLIKIKNTT